MSTWPPFSAEGKTYDLSHLNGSVVNLTREASGDQPEKVYRAYLTYTEHAFTEHYTNFWPEEVYEYPSNGRDPRYFDVDRYELSKALPDYVPRLLESNPYLGRTFLKHREQFFYLEEKVLDVDCRLFFEIAHSAHPDSDFRIKVVSSHPQRPGAQPVGVSDWHKFWHVATARIEGRSLPKRQTGRRSRRR